MSRRSRGLMSDELKWELAQELGVTNVVSTEGWGGVSARDCGNLVKLAIMRAEESMARDYAQGRSYAVAGGPEAFPYWAVAPGMPRELRR